MTVQPTPQFRQRPMLEIQPGSGAPRISIMTYNLLAQSLARRNQFPTSGPALKWAARSKALLAEIAFYSPDILCVQELDSDRWDSFWRPELAKCGYNGVFHHHPDKRHGVAVIYKEAIFVLDTLRFVDYDSVPGKTLYTGNVALLVYLRFSPDFPGTSQLEKEGILVGTTHLYWHPFGTYERCRQAHILMQEFEAFENQIGASKCYNFVAGDFNTDPPFPPYMLLTNGGFSHPQSCRTVCRARDHDFSASAIDDEMAPKEYAASEEALRDYHVLKEWREKHSLAAVSLYSMGYAQAHPRNVQDNEPSFSNWCEHFVALIDYIFVFSCSPVNNKEELTSRCGVRLLELLRMPEKSEMGKGLPQPKTYASDHLCLMAKVELL